MSGSDPHYSMKYAVGIFHIKGGAVRGGRLGACSVGMSVAYCLFVLSR